MPRAPIIRTNNVTMEGMRDVLAHEGQCARMCNIFVDELMNFFRSLYRQENSNAVDDAIEGYEGGAKEFFRARKGGMRDADIIHVPNWCFGIFGTIQTDAFAEAEKKYQFVSRGFSQRFCVVIGRANVPGHYDGPEIDELEGTLTSIAIEISRYPGREYRLSEEAREIWRREVAVIEERARILERYGDSAKLNQAMQKFGGTVGRIALTLHLVEHAERTIGAASAIDLNRQRLISSPVRGLPPEEVSAATMARAVRLFLDWLLPHMIALTQAFAGDIHPLRTVAGWLLERDAADANRFTKRGLQRGPAPLKGAWGSSQFEIIARLEAAGWLIPVVRDARGFAVTWETHRGIARRFSANLEEYRKVVAWFEEQRRSAR